MFSSIRNFVSRHRRKFFISGAVVGGVYLLTSYAQKKLREWQERETRRFLDVTRKKQHFESTERTCNQTILSLAKVVCESVLRVLDTEDIVDKLQQSPENKLELWEQLKVMIFSRICVLVYALCILQVTLRVQLNIIGGYLYKDSIHNEGQPPTISSDLQSKYLSLCHHFISDGIEELAKQVDKKVRKVMEPISLKKKVTLQEVEQVFWSIQASLCTEDDPIKQMVAYLVSESTALSDPALDSIIKETIDVLESEEVISLTMSSVSRCFSSVVDEIAHLFAPKTAPNKNQLEVGGETHIVTNGALKVGLAASPFVDVNKVEIHLVKLLPVVNDLVIKNTCRGNTSIPDLLIQQLTLNDKLRVLGANIYEVFSSA